jgi:hypothetical protein
LENDEDVKIVLYILAESVAARLRENGFRCRVVEISIRDNELFSFTRQKKIDHATNITSEIGAYAYQIFKASYDWRKPIRSVGDTGQLSHRNSAPGRLAKVDRLFEKTCYAKEIDEMAAALVESFISHLSSRDDLEKAAVTVAEGIKDYSTSY